MNSTSFGEYVNAGGFIQKIGPGTTVIHSKQANRHQQVIQPTKPAKVNSRWSLGHKSAPAFYVDSPPPLRVHLRRCSRSVHNKGSDFMLPWIHGPTGLLVPPIKGPPYLLQKGTLHIRASLFHTHCMQCPSRCLSPSCIIENRERGEERDLRRSRPVRFSSTLYLDGSISSLSNIQVLLLEFLRSLAN